MSYQGGKQKIGKRIYDILLSLEKKYKKENLVYFEPFVGFCGVIKHFNNSKRELYACDENKYIISLWRALQQGWIPPDSCSKEQYYNMRENFTEEEHLRGFIGSVCSYGGIFFGGYKGSTNYAKVGKSSTLKIAENVINVNFLDACSYDTFDPNGMLIYCDPPYRHNTFSQITKFFKFDSNRFWDIMRKWSRNNIVVISEYEAPDDFVKLWSRDIDICSNNNTKTVIECLFTHSSSPTI